MYIVAGLGNPGEEYLETRHNVGRMSLFDFQKKENFKDWSEDKKNSALVSKGDISGNKVFLVLPELYMNKSGLSLKRIVTSKKKAEKLIVIYDDLDLPLGKIKVSFDKNSGGHRGIESIIRSIGTKSFIRIRIGISPTSPSGKLKKPKGEEDVKDFILGNFNKKEKEKLGESFNTVRKIVNNITTFGREKALSMGF